MLANIFEILWVPDRYALSKGILLAWDRYNYDFCSSNWPPWCR